MPCPLWSAAWWTDKGTGYSYTVAVVFQVRQLPLLPGSPVSLSASYRVNILLLIYNAGRTHYLKVSVEWWTLGEHVRLGSCRAQATSEGTGSGDAKANLCWRSVFGGVRQCVSTINLITTRFSRLRSTQLDSDSLCLCCLTGWTTLAARPHVLLVAF